MGADQSTQSGGSGRNNLRREKSMPEKVGGSADTRNAANADEGISPEQSVCSDSDLPYVPYTVNRPIGDSPLKKPKRLPRGKSLPRQSSMTLLQMKSKSQDSPEKLKHSIVVVKKAAPPPNKYDDPDLKKLQETPTFLPIMPKSVNQPSQRDPEVLEKLDAAALVDFCHLYQNHLHRCATNISTEQNKISKSIAQIDKDVANVMTTFTERQKSYSKYVEHFSKVNEMNEQLEKLNITLTSSIQMVAALNEALPDDEKLEEFSVKL